MKLTLPERKALRQIQIARRQVPVDQIIAVEGQSPVASGINAMGDTLGAALEKRAQLRRQGEQLAKLEALGGQQPGAYQGLDPSVAATFTGSAMKNKADVAEKARELSEKTTKIRALEGQFGYKPNELGDDYEAAKMKVQSDLMEKRAEAARTASGGGADESFTIAGSDEQGNIIQVGNKSGKLRTIPLPGGGVLRPKNEAPPTPEAAGRLAMLQSAVSDLDSLDSMIFDKNGSLNRAMVFNAGVPGGGMPFTKGRDVNSLIENAVAAKLRLETGTAAPPAEVTNISNRFKPTMRDTSETAKNKLARLREFMTTAIGVADPRGNKLTPLPMRNAGPKRVGRFTVEEGQ